MHDRLIKKSFLEHDVPDKLTDFSHKNVKFLLLKIISLLLGWVAE